MVLPRQLLAAMVSLPLLSCRAPTQVLVELSTDINCSDKPNTGISVGPLSQLESRPVSTETFQCEPSTGRIGSIVIIPGGDNDSEFAIRVVSGITMSADDCVRSGYLGGCVVARRILGFVPHETLYLPIRMEASCIGVPCGKTETCRAGTCVSAKITNIDACTSTAGCDVTRPMASGGSAGNTRGSAIGGATNASGEAEVRGGTGAIATTSTFGAGGIIDSERTNAVGSGGLVNVSSEVALGGRGDSSGGNIASGGVTATTDTTATTGGATSTTGGATATTGGATAIIDTTATTGGVTATTGGTTATNGGTAATIDTTATSGGVTATTGGSSSVSFTPACTTTGSGISIYKGLACVAADPQLCYWPCGPMETGHRSETCTSGLYVEGDCQFPTDVNYSCFKVPQTDSADCPATAPQSGQACNIPKCSLPCGGSACEMCGIATGYHDTLGTAKVGYCVCVAGAAGSRWSCATKISWPCPAGHGC